MSGRPQLWVFGGPNGAGKSTLADAYVRGRLPIVNPDTIAHDLPRRPDGRLDAVEAGRIALGLRRDHIRDRRSFAFETTLTGASELRTLRAARAAGYKVNLVFVGLGSPAASGARVSERVRRGGHDVPVEAIERRYARSLAALAEAAELAERVVIFDNGGRRRRLLLVHEQGRTRHHAELPPWAAQAIPASFQAPDPASEAAGEDPRRGADHGS